MKIIFDYNRTIFDPDTDNVYPGVLELLQRLSARHELVLVSRNEPARKKRIEELTITNYFQKIVFVNEKSKQLFKEIAGNEKKVMVVGDSISDEITIGNQLGLITVRLKKGKFAVEIPKDNNELARYEITDINELENIIARYEE